MGERKAFIASVEKHWRSFIEQRKRQDTLPAEAFKVAVCHNEERRKMAGIVGFLHLRHIGVTPDRDNESLLPPLKGRLALSKLLYEHSEDCRFPDHFPVFIETVLDKPQARKKTVSYRSIKRIDPVALKIAISHSHLADMNSDLPLEKQVCLYDSGLGAILNEMAPLKTKTITSRTDVEWYNEQIREAKQGRRRAERRWRGSQLQVDKEIFIEHRHKINELIDVSKRDHYRNLITSCSDQGRIRAPEGPWQASEARAPSKRGPVACATNATSCLAGNVRHNPQKKTPLVLAEMFSQFFIEKISDIRDSIPDVNDPTPLFPSPACSFTQFAPLHSLIYVYMLTTMYVSVKDRIDHGGVNRVHQDEHLVNSVQTE
ncbi:hypothetical protein CAPTEDRAFT_200106 [Capitella teleta]|uniref:Uncharacterized protein n=1 Tax=Capitella teleta TaxID=283909 RepID=R7V3K2_CAPTE|nr:hypothetical protein CAPTEDRAFT_200106 [Capitella teleta]|eukprot:ELU13052.1 hypothetical protein CAPTEDRAFT_200106 [Capitella teleta]